ncbi:competence/damage-inducible protein A [Methylomonas rhizoryzae]|uniref:competence/damage-inducible protein A n=1 Tax=Methylomonas rhizoryzae TaxID=2608981 RepID=UPI0012318A34|nr:molybdopterin-binding protein [Methylomonas rhizoryzae]
MNPVAEIFSQGQEVVSGHIVDSNAAWLATELTEIGFRVTRHSAVGDRLEELVALMKEIAGRADCCICTGGLGPTCDDLTAEAVRVAAGTTLELDETALAQIESYFQQRQRSMPDINRKQAYLPGGARRIDNLTGTAPGFALRMERCLFVFLPGVPREMKAMYPQVRLLLQAEFALLAPRLVTLRSVGIGESGIQQLLDGFEVPAGIELGFRAAADEVQTKLLFPGDYDPLERHRIAQRLRELIGDCVFAVDGLDDGGGDLLATIDRDLRDRHLRVALLETASGGALAAKCQAYDWLEVAFVAKNDKQAARQLNVALENSEDPAVSVRQLAYGLSAYRADIELLQLFRADAGGFRLYNFLQTHEAVYHRQHFLFGAHFNQTQTAVLTLDLLRRYLQQCL